MNWDKIPVHEILSMKFDSSYGQYEKDPGSLDSHDITII